MPPHDPPAIAAPAPPLPASNPPRWRIILAPLPGGPPAVVRVRRLLKAAVRAYGLRCVDVREESAAGGGDA